VSQPAADPDAFIPSGPPAQAGIRSLVGLAIFNHVAFSGARVCLTITALHLNASTFQVGLLLSLLAMPPMLMAIPLGRLIDRTGSRWPMRLGTLVLAIGILLPGLSLSMPALIASALLVGMGFMPFHLGIQKLISQLGSIDERRHNLSVMTIGFSVSAFIGPTSAGFLIDGPGNRLAFCLFAVLPMIAFVWQRLISTRLIEQHAEPPAADSPQRLRDLLVTADMRRLYIVVVLISSAWEVNQFVVPLYCTKIGISASGIGLILGAFAVATLVVRMVVPLFLMNVSEWRVVLAAMAVAALVYACYPLFSTLESLIALSFLLGLGLGVSQPMTLSIMARSVPEGRLGEATGLRLALVMGMQTALPTAFGALGAVFGVGLLFWGMAALLGTGIVGVGRSVLRD